MPLMPVATVQLVIIPRGFPLNNSFTGWCAPDWTLDQPNSTSCGHLGCQLLASTITKYSPLVGSRIFRPVLGSFGKLTLLARIPTMMTACFL